MFLGTAIDIVTPLRKLALVVLLPVGQHHFVDEGLALLESATQVANNKQVIHLIHPFIMFLLVGHRTFLFEPHQAVQLGGDLPGTMWPTAPSELEVLLQNLSQGLGKGTQHEQCLVAAMANAISTHPGLVPTTSPKVNHILVTPQQLSRGLQGL